MQGIAFKFDKSSVSLQHSPRPTVCFTGVCGSGSGARRYRVTMLPPSEPPSPSSSDGPQTRSGAKGMGTLQTSTAGAQQPRSRSRVSVLAEADGSVQSNNKGDDVGRVSSITASGQQQLLEDEVSDCLTEFFNNLLIDLQVWPRAGVGR